MGLGFKVYNTSTNDLAEKQNTVQYGTVRFSTVPEHVLVPYNTAPYHTVPYRTIDTATVRYCAGTCTLACTRTLTLAFSVIISCNNHTVKYDFLDMSHQNNGLRNT